MFILPQMFLACVVENGGAFILAISVKSEPLNFHNDARKKRNDQKHKKNMSTKLFFQRKKIYLFFSIFQDFKFSLQKNNYLPQFCLLFLKTAQAHHAYSIDPTMIKVLK